MNDKILVRLVNVEDDILITSFWTTAWSEVFKMYSAIHSLGDDAPDITTFVDNDNFKYNDSMFKIRDIEIQFGSVDAINSLNIYVEVF